MALTHIHRRRAPLDGTVFATMANLNSMLRNVDRFDWVGERPSVVNQIEVPIYVRMEKYKAQVTKKAPDGMIYGPVVRIGSMDSPEIIMHSDHWACRLSRDYELDGCDAVNEWHYHPLRGAGPWEPGEDSSMYLCDKCGHHLYRDESGRRSHKSACIFDGGLVCRDCEATGAVYDSQVEAQFLRARTLASFIGDECRASLERSIERLSGDTFFGSPAQTRFYKEDSFSFGWSTKIITPEGPKSGMYGGLIKHGPHAKETPGGYEFTTWDYKLEAERPATLEEIKNIRWSTHT